jgi:hypothetical protein
MVVTSRGDHLHFYHLPVESGAALKETAMTLAQQVYCSMMPIRSSLIRPKRVSYAARITAVAFPITPPPRSCVSMKRCEHSSSPLCVQIRSGRFYVIIFPM